jgi:hypothetical protein
VRADIPERLEEAILRALDPTPEKRFKTVHELGHTLVSFASPTGRGRWKPYYRTPPRPIDPVTTGPIPVDAFNQVRAALRADPATAPSAPATVAAPEYDFKAHERTTVPSSDAIAASFAEAATLTKSTAIDHGAASAIRPMVSAEPSSIDIAFSEARPVSDAHGKADVLAPSSATAAHVGRRRVALAAGIGAALVVAVTAVTIHLRERPAKSVAPSPPAWTTQHTERTPPSRPEAPVPVAPAPAPTAEPVPLVTAPARGTEEGTRPTPPPARRSKHRRAPAPAIQFGDDGLPILH